MANTVYLSSQKCSGLGCAAPRSPPPERIIRNVNLHPRTVGQFDSTRKLCNAPSIKTLISKRSGRPRDADAAAEDPVYFHYLGLLSAFHEVPAPDEDTDINDVVAKMVSAIGRLNRLHTAAPRVSPHCAVLDCDKRNVSLISYHNAFNCLVNYIDYTEIHKSSEYISYRVKHRFDNQWYFLKMGINKRMSEEFQSLTRSNLEFLNDIKTVARTDHSNIVTYYTSWYEQRTFIIQLEYIIGDSLYYFLYSRKKSERSEFKMLPLTNKISEIAAAKIIREIGAAVNYLHNNLGVVHNDIQPTHILISKNGSLSIPMTLNNVEELRSKMYQSLLSHHLPDNVTFKLTGFAQSFDLDKVPTVFHTSDYSLPASSQVDCSFTPQYLKRDIFSLGMTLLHAMNGALHFPKSAIIKERSCGFLNIQSCNLKELLETMIHCSKTVPAEHLEDFYV